MNRTIDIYADRNCPSCNGAGYRKVNINTNNINLADRLPCQCIMKQIPSVAIEETDYKIMPAKVGTKE